MSLQDKLDAFKADFEGKKAPPHVVRSNAAGALVPPRPVGPVPVAPLAADVLHGRVVDDAAAGIVADWGRTHGA